MNRDSETVNGPKFQFIGLLNKVDAFGQVIEVNVAGKSKHSTFFGGGMTIAFYTFMLAYAV